MIKIRQLKNKAMKKYYKLSQNKKYNKKNKI